MIVASLQLAAAMALVGVNVPVAKLLSLALPIPAVAFLRCIIACIVLLPLAAAIDGGLRLPRKAGWNLLGQAVFGTALYNLALLAGLRLTSALEAGLVLASLPAVIALAAWAAFGERLALRGILGVTLAVAAIATLNAARGPAGAAPVGSLAGNALVFGCVLAETVYVLLGKRLAAGGRMRVFTASLWMQVFSVVILAPLALPDLVGLAAGQATPMLAGLMLFHATTSSVLCLVLWYQGLKRAPAVMGGISAIFLPAGAALASMLLLDEAATAIHALGFVLIAGSVALAGGSAARAVTDGAGGDAGLVRGKSR